MKHQTLKCKNHTPCEAELKTTTRRLITALGVRIDMMWYDMMWYDTIYDMIHLLTSIGLAPGGSSTVRICTQTIYRQTQ